MGSFYVINRDFEAKNNVLSRTNQFVSSTQHWFLPNRAKSLRLFCLEITLDSFDYAVSSAKTTSGGIAGQPVANTRPLFAQRSTGRDSELKLHSAHTLPLDMSSCMNPQGILLVEYSVESRCSLDVEAQIVSGTDPHQWSTQNNAKAKLET